MLVLKQRLLKFKSFLSSQIFPLILELRTPLSKSLQTKGMDVLKGYQMVMKTIASLEQISSNFTDVKDKTVSFAAWANEELERNDAPDSDVVENELPLPRTRR